MQFLDEAKIYLKSGDGGPGCVSFRREKFIDRGGPNGGNGGKGGDVTFICAGNLNTLIDYRYKQHFKAKNGEHGKGQNRNGSNADDTILTVPVGTQILTEDKEDVLFDFTEVGQEFTLLRGGDGGFGNAHYKSSVNQAPRRFTPGWPGAETWVWLQLKLISDVGIVGLPNAGKSTFLSRVSSARPKIADYPFTTLKPQLGVAYIDESEFVVADIPGLIENAHMGAGLGDKFLKHIERCGVLLHLIDGTAENIEESYNIIRTELNEYSEELAHKKEIIAINKIDAILEEDLHEKIILIKEISGQDKIYTISAQAGMNITEILRELKKQVDIFHGKLVEEEIF